MKQLILIALFLMASTLLGQNVMTISSESGNAGSIVDVQIEIDNADPFVAFEARIQMSDQLAYVDGSAALTVRSDDHAISGSVISGNTLVILGYSTSGSSFIGSSGSVASFQLELGDVPGDYPLNPGTAIIGDNGANNILTQLNNGQVTVLAPDISIGSTELNYQRTIVWQTRDLSFSINNNGNVTLNLDSLVSSNATVFAIQSGWSTSIGAYGSQQITVRFQPNEKGNQTGAVKIYSDDPDETLHEVSLSGLAYKVNELHVNPLSVKSGDDTTLTIRMNNQENIAGVQFDLNLPDCMRFIEASENLTGRASGHSIGVNLVNSHTLRVVAHSSDNSAFTGTAGDLIELDFHVEGVGGSYPVNVSNIILSDVVAENVISDSYNSQVNIAASDISSQTNINYPDATIFDTTHVDLQINNQGNDVLRIQSVKTSNASFWIDESLPIEINPSNNTTIRTYFHSPDSGHFNGQYRFYSNDPDESPFSVQCSAISYSPNKMEVLDATGYDGENVTIELEIVNHDPFTAFQTDIIFPDELTLIPDSTDLTNRKDGHTLVQQHISDNRYRYICYSASLSNFSGNNGTVLKMVCEVSGNPGTYDITLSNSIISNEIGQNILNAADHGELTIASTTVQQTIGMLPNKLNMISFNVEPDVSTIVQMADDVPTLLVAQDDAGNYYIPPYGVDLIINVDFSKGYQIYYTAQDNQNLVNEGLPLDPNALCYNFTNTKLFMIPYPYQAAHPVVDVFASIGDKVVVVQDDAGNFWIPQYFVDGIGNMQPGRGYQIYVDEACNFCFPDLEGMCGQIAKSIQMNALGTKTEFATEADTLQCFKSVESTGTSQPVIIQQVNLPEGSLQEGDEIGVFDNDLCVGAAQYKDGYPVTIAAWIKVSLPDDRVLPGAELGDTIRYKIWQKSTDILYAADPTYTDGNGIFGETITVVEPLEATETLSCVETIEGSVVPNKFMMHQNYPNPFNPTTTIRYDVAEASEIQIIVYNLMGQQIRMLLNGFKEAGNYEMKWDGYNDQKQPVGAGVYLLYFKAGSNHSVRKMIKLL